MNCQSLFEKFPRKLHIDSHKDPSTLEIQILGDNVTKGPSPLLTIALLNVHTAITLRAPKPQNPLELQRDQAAQQWTDYTYYYYGGLSFECSLLMTSYFVGHTGNYWIGCDLASLCLKFNESVTKHIIIIIQYKVHFHSFTWPPCCSNEQIDPPSDKALASQIIASLIE